jgi:hypothetical protein
MGQRGGQGEPLSRVKYSTYIPNILNIQSELAGMNIALLFKKSLKVVLENGIRNWWHVSEPLSSVKYNPTTLNIQKRTYRSGYCTSVLKNLKVVLESSIRNWWHVSEPLSRVKYNLLF